MIKGKDIEVHLGRNVHSRGYYIHSAFPIKQAPSENKARKMFYKKNNLAKRLEEIERIENNRAEKGRFFRSPSEIKTRIKRYL